MATTSFTLRFRHCIERGAEQPYIDRLIRHARIRWEDFHQNPVTRWATTERCDFSYSIPLDSVIAAGHYLGMPVPELLIRRMLPHGVEVRGAVHLRQHRLSIEVAHTTVRQPLSLLVTPIIKGKTRDQIVDMAYELFGPEFELAAE